MNLAGMNTKSRYQREIAINIDPNLSSRSPRVSTDKGLDKEFIMKTNQSGVLFSRKFIFSLTLGKL